MRRLIGIVLLILALVQFTYRGTQRVRAEVPLWDFDSVYAAARTWVHGGNPYDLPSVLVTWHNAGVFSDRPVGYFATVYPPNSLCMIIPFAVLPAGAALISWGVISLALLALQFAALADLTGLGWRDARVLILIGASLVSAPFQFALLSGQLSLPAISLCIIAFWCGRRDRAGLAGILLGIACAIKPQIGAPFVVYYLLLRRWSVAGTAILLSGAVVVVALVAMRISHIDWFTGMVQSIALTTRIGGVNDYGWTAYFRDEIMDLKMLLISVLHDTRALRIGVEAIVLVLALWFLRVFRWDAQLSAEENSASDREQLLMIAGLTAISFLPVYHRLYDAALLTTALAWALAELDGPRRRYAVVMFVPMALFLIPFNFTETVARRLHFLAKIVHTGWWQALLAPHYAWALLGLTVVILVTLSRAFNRSARPVSGISPAEQRSPMLQRN